MADLLISSALLFQLITNDGKHLARLTATVVFRQFRDNHAIQADLPGIARQIPNQFVSSIPRLSEAKRPAFGGNCAGHIEQGAHSGRVMCEIHKDFEAVHVIDIAAPRVLILLHGFQTLGNLLEGYTETPGQRGGSQRIGHIVSRRTT